MLAFALLHAADAWAGDDGRVAIVTTDARSPMVARLRAELLGVGLVPVVVVREPVGDHLGSVADEVDVVAVFGVREDRELIEVWVVDATTGEERVREVAMPSDDPLAASVVGTQAVEVLRASLLELHEDDAPAPSTSVADLVAWSEPEADPDPLVHHVVVAAGGLFGAEGAPLVQLRAEYALEISRLFGVFVRVDGSVLPVTESDAYGRARLWLAHSVVGPRLTWDLVGRSRIFAAFGAGLALAHVAGTSTDPSIEDSSSWIPGFVGSGEIGVHLPLWRGESTSVDLDVTVEVSVSDRVRVVQEIDGVLEPLLSWGPARGALWLGVDVAFW